MLRIPLGNKPDLFTVIDDGDAELVLEHRWYVLDTPRNSGRIYAHTQLNEEGRRWKTLHRLLLNAERHQIVDHVNGDGLDNRRSNLRFASAAQNRWNSRPHRGHSSRFKGVCWNRASSKWQVAIKVYGRSIYLGLFVAEEDAARAYDAAATKHFGSFARLNLNGEVA